MKFIEFFNDNLSLSLDKINYSFFEGKEVKDFASHSSYVENGDIFLDFSKDINLSIKNIKAAIHNGAILVISEHNYENIIIASEYSLNNFEFLKVKNINLFLNKLSELFYSEVPKTIVAVTGTNGKTSSNYYLANINSFLNKTSFSINTIGLDHIVNGELKRIQENALTTLPKLEFKRFLHNFKNVDLFTFEASSHGLYQGRIGSILVDYAIFLNLTQDHLDYHKNMEEYYLAKKMLFTHYLKFNGNAIINIDDKYGMRLITELNQERPDLKIATFGASFLSDYNFDIIKISPKNINFTLSYNMQKYNIKTNFSAKYQLYNLMSAIVVLNKLGNNLEDIVKIIPSLKAPNGRMELVTRKDGKLIYIDYAHTPDALKNVLKTL